MLPGSFSLDGSKLHFTAFVRFDNWMRRTVIILQWQLQAEIWTDTFVSSIRVLGEAPVKVMQAVKPSASSSLWLLVFAFLLGKHASLISCFVAVGGEILWSVFWLWNSASVFSDSHFLSPEKTLEWLCKPLIPVCKYFYLDYLEGLQFSWPNSSDPKPQILISKTEIKNIPTQCLHCEN